MTETPVIPGEAEPIAPEPGAPRTVPRIARVLAVFAIVAVAVAVYAFVRVGSSDESLDGGVTLQNALASSAAPAPGEIAPDFTVPTLDGDSFSLSRHLAEDGRPVLVNMWAEWCFPCRTEMPAIDAASRNHPEVRFIGVVVRDDEGPTRRFVEDYDITYEIGLDTERLVEERYAIWAMPSTYLIGSDGRVLGRYFGPMKESQLEELLAKAAAS